MEDSGQDGDGGVIPSLSVDGSLGYPDGGGLHPMLFSLPAPFPTLEGMVSPIGEVTPFIQEVHPLIQELDILV